MTYAEIKVLAERFCGSATQRTFEGEDWIMVVQEKQPENRLGIELWSKGIFIAERDNRWVIGFGQTERLDELSSVSLKEALTAWLNEPNDEILRNYVALEQT